MLLLSQGCCFIQSLLFSYVLQEDSVKFSRKFISVPCQPSKRHSNTVRTLISQQHPFERRGIPSGRSSVQSTSRSDDVSYRPDTHQSTASSVRTTRTSCPDLPLCQEASNCSSLHLSGRFSSPPDDSQCSTKLQIFFPKSNMGRLLQPSGRRGFPSGRATP
jgi:hypothetical protein